jgi:hypothetical protein
MLIILTQSLQANSSKLLSKRILSEIFQWLCLNSTYLLTHSLTHLLIYLLTPHSTVLLEKLTGLHPVKIFATFYGTRSLLK